MARTDAKKETNPGERSYEVGGRESGEAATKQGPSRISSHTRSGDRVMNCLSLKASSINTANCLVSDFWPPDL